MPASVSRRVRARVYSPYACQRSQRVKRRPGLERSWIRLVHRRIQIHAALRNAQWRSSRRAHRLSIRYFRDLPFFLFSSSGGFYVLTRDPGCFEYKKKRGYETANIMHRRFLGYENSWEWNKILYLLMRFCLYFGIKVVYYCKLWYRE